MCLRERLKKGRLSTGGVVMEIGTAYWFQIKGDNLFTEDTECFTSLYLDSCKHSKLKTKSVHCQRFLLASFQIFY